MRKKTWAVLAVILVGGAGYLLWPRNATPPPAAQQIAAPPTVVAEPPPTQPSQGPVEAAILHPLDTAQEMETPLAPGSADTALLDALRKTLDKNWLELIVPDRLLQHIVATVDNLPRKYLPASVVPLRRAQGAFMVARLDQALQIDSRNSARYTHYVRLIQATNAEKLVSTYRRFYPSLQKAYEELGYPKAYFNDRLVEAIDDLLAAPDADEPISLAQPKILFEFADPELQGRSAGQKIMIRVGRENSALIKEKLSEIRKLVSSSSAAS